MPCFPLSASLNWEAWDVNGLGGSQPWWQLGLGGGRGAGQGVHRRMALVLLWKQLADRCEPGTRLSRVFRSRPLL